MNKQLTWEAPTTSPSHGYDWAEIATMLKAHPGQWLKVFDDGPLSIINAIRQQEIAALTPRRTANGEGFEVQTRNNKKGPPRTASLYLRWIGK